jgi:ABC-type phosphate/phosphonate transport system substrate-binding protein
MPLLPTARLILAAIFWTSHGYSHCNFTAHARLPASLAERFTKAIEAMDYNAPKWKQIMNLEGLTRWMPGSTEGYDELEREARPLDMLSEPA